MAPVALRACELLRRAFGLCRHASLRLPLTALLLLVPVDEAPARDGEHQTSGEPAPGGEVRGQRAVDDHGSSTQPSVSQAPAASDPADRATGEPGSGGAPSSKAFGALERVFPKAGPAPMNWTDVDPLITPTAQPPGAWSTFTRMPANDAPPAVQPPRADAVAPATGKRAVSRRPHPVVEVAVKKAAAKNVTAKRVAAKKAAAKKMAAKRVAAKRVEPDPRSIPLPSVREPTTEP